MTRTARLLTQAASAIGGSGWGIVLRLGGLAGVIYETRFEQVDRPYLLAIFGGMMGLPSFVRKDESQPGGKHKETRERDDKD